MASRVLSIEVGYEITRICEVESGKGKKGLKELKRYMIPTPNGTLDDGAIKSPDELAASIKELLIREKIKTKQVIFNISSSRIVFREAVIPAVKKNRVRDVIMANLNQYLPIDIKGYKLDFLETGAITNEDGSKQLKILLFAMPNYMVDSYKEFADMAGLMLQAVDYAGNSTYQATKQIFTEGNKLLIRVGEKTTVTMAFQGNESVLNRNVFYGVETAIRVVMRQYRCSFLEALSMMTEQSMLHDLATQRQSGLDMEQAASAEEIFKEDLRQALDMLMNGILKVIDFYNLKNRDNPLDTIFIGGLGSEVKGLADYIEQASGIKTIPLLTLPELYGDAHIGAYLNCLGAAVRPLEFYTTEKEKKEKASNTEGGISWSLAWTILGIGVVASILVVTLQTVNYFSLKKDNLEYRKYITDNSEIISVYNEYMQAKNARDIFVEAEEATDYPSNEVAAFIEEMEQKLPTDVCLTSIQMDTQTVTLDMSAIGVEEAVDAIAQIRQFESLTDITVNNINDSSEEKPDTGIVTFSIQGYFVPIEKTVTTVDAASATTDAGTETAGTTTE